MAIATTSRFLAAVACLLLLDACSDAGLAEARDVVDVFCAAVAAGNAEGARACLVAADRGDRTRKVAPQGLRDGYEVGAARRDGDHARVDVLTKGAPAPVTFVLVREEQHWRIDLQQSTVATLGSKLEQVRKVIDQAGKQMVERLEQSRRENKTPSPLPATPR